MNTIERSLEGLSLRGDDRELLSDNPVATPKRKLIRSVSESDSGPVSEKGLWARRKNKMGLELGNKPHFQINRNPVECVVAELRGKFSCDNFQPLGSPITSSNGALSLYGVPGNDGQQLFIHSLYINEGSQVARSSHEWSTAFWEHVSRYSVEKIIALADPAGLPIYMPPEKNQEAYKSNPIAVGDARTFPNGLRVEVKNVTVLNELAEVARKVNPASQNDPVAREITLELITEDQEKRIISVDQIFNCWSDTVPLPSEIGVQIAGRFVSQNMQIHCEGGKNRSPAAVAMWLINGKRDQLKANNFVDEIAEVINIVRSWRHDMAAINDHALQSIVQFALNIKGLVAEDILPFFIRVNGPKTAPAQSSIQSFSVGLAGTNE